MHSMFEANDTMLYIRLIDASSALNSLNRAAALHNTRILFPSISTYAINTCSKSVCLLVIGGRELTSAEGTTYM